jgi:endonuclease YncB( thermonuclease family)
MAGICEHGGMFLPSSRLHMSVLRISTAVLLAGLSVAASTRAMAAEACAFDTLGDGHVSAIVDGRSFRLADGREIRLAGIEPTEAADKDRTAALRAILADRDVTLRGADDAPDRYGRQTAFVFLSPSDALVQEELLAQGAALVSTEIVDKDCSKLLMAAEEAARLGKKGTWADPSAIKNAESADDILAGIGRFMLVEGKVLSVRQAGATTYLNFGRNWTRDFAATISRRMMPAIESAGITLKSLENRRIRVRGWIEAHPGPRMEVLRASQIELAD